MLVGRKCSEKEGGEDERKKEVREVREERRKKPEDTNQSMIYA